MPRSPQALGANTIAVASVDTAVGNVQKNGGTVVAPKMAIPGVGWLAYFKDPDGNASGSWNPTRTPGKYFQIAIIEDCTNPQCR